ncbi:MAG: glycosyltransferase [Verrucomicrobiaceae bacterium]|nr:MAG: glycosyltransferase [Verrucomicrobiaceae bacterium]
MIHYHSGDVVDFLNQSVFRQWLGKMVYGRGAWSIRLGEGCPVPGKEMGADRVIDIPNGIHVPDQLPRLPNSPSFRILFLGNLFEDKGILDVIQAAGLFAANYSGHIRLSLVGAWPDESTRIRVEEALESLPHTMEVTPPAPAYGNDKWRILADADVLVFPSRYRRENVPLVILEAMACGLPVIASLWRGIPSLVEDGRTGYLVPVSDPRAITEKLCLLAANPELRSRLGKNAAENYRNRFTLNQHINSVRSALLAASRS